MFSKILVCSDGSESALAAARLAAQIAQKFQSSVLLLHVCLREAIATPTFVAGVWELAVSPELMETHAAQAREALQKQAIAIFDAAKIPCELLIDYGHPVETILHFAEQREADLIVVGSSGMSGGAEFLLGSVSESVLRHARASVLIGRGAAGGGGLKRILLAADCGEAPRPALPMAATLAAKFHAVLTALHVTKEAGLLTEITDAFNETCREDYSKSLLDALRRSVEQEAGAAGATVVMRQETGSPAPVILRVAEEEDSDLIVLGSRGLGTIKAFLLGSVSNKVAHHAQRSLLVAR